MPNFPPHVTSCPDSRAYQDSVDDFLICLAAGRIPDFMDLASANTKEFRREVLSACDADGGTREGGKPAGKYRWAVRHRSERSFRRSWSLIQEAKFLLQILSEAYRRHCLSNDIANDSHAGRWGVNVSITNHKLFQYVVLDGSGKLVL